MEVLPGRKRRKSKSRGPNNRLSLGVWLFYIGIVSLSLTSVTFSRYSTVVRGTISVQVADVFTVTFIDGDTLVEEKKVYEGQSVKEAPMCLDKTTDIDGVSTSIPFLGWSQSPDAIDTVIPEEIAVDKDLIFYAVYGEPPKKLLVLATPSEAIATSSNAAAPEKTTPEANTTVSEPAAPAEPEPSAPTVTETIPTEQEPSLASPSNATAANNN